MLLGIVGPVSSYIGTIVKDSRRERFVTMRGHLISSHVLSATRRFPMVHSCSSRALLYTCASRRMAPGASHDTHRVGSLNAEYFLEANVWSYGIHLCFLLQAALAVEYDIHHKRGVLDNTERACIAAAATAAVLVGRLSRGKSRNPQPLFVCLFVFVYAEIKILVPLGQRNP